MRNSLIVIARLLAGSVGALCLCGPALSGEKVIGNPEWVFEDDFEGGKASFWGGGTNVVFGGACTSDASKSSKTIVFTYNPQNDPLVADSWAEQRFAIPIKAQQLEISYRVFVPSNYLHAPKNHKGIVLWSGEYGKVNANVAVSSENWPVEGKGAKPSVYIGYDGVNYGHSTVPNGPLMFVDGYGAWQRVHIYLELAKEPGDHGVFEVHRNGEFVVGTSYPDIAQQYGMPPTSEQIGYATRGNFIDQGYVLGWANGGFRQTTVMCVDDFSIKANATIQAVVEQGDTSPPKPPHLTVD